MKKLILFASLLAFAFVQPSSAQFTQIELFSGVKKIDFSLYSSKVLLQKNKLSLATLAFFHKFKTNKNLDEIGVQPTVFWNANKSFSIGPSFYYNSMAAYSNRLSVKYTFKNSKLLLAVIPSIGHTRGNMKEKLYAEFFTQFQYCTPIKKNIKLYMNGQFLTVWKSFKNHARSFQQFRIGLSVQTHQVGIGLDLDQYGALILQKSTYGFYYRKTI